MITPAPQVLVEASGQKNMDEWAKTMYRSRSLADTVFTSSPIKTSLMILSPDEPQLDKLAVILFKEYSCSLPPTINFIGLTFIPLPQNPNHFSLMKWMEDYPLTAEETEKPLMLPQKVRTNFAIIPPWLGLT